MLLNRRRFLAAIAMGVATPALAQFAPSTPFPQAFSSFVVDVSALKAKGLGPFADLVGQAAFDELGRSFADRVDPQTHAIHIRG